MSEWGSDGLESVTPRTACRPPLVYRVPPAVCDQERFNPRMVPWDHFQEVSLKYIHIYWRLCQGGGGGRMPREILWLSQRIKIQRLCPSTISVLNTFLYCVWDACWYFLCATTLWKWKRKQLEWCYVQHFCFLLTAHNSRKLSFIKAVLMNIYIWTWGTIFCLNHLNFPFPLIDEEKQTSAHLLVLFVFSLTSLQHQPFVFTVVFLKWDSKKQFLLSL